MMNFSEAQKKWQKRWEDDKAFHASNDSDKEKYYVLVEFPYPSGSGLHVGHVRSYSALDAMSRMKRMQGYNVLFPMGWDAFGAPAEQYAIKNHIYPADAVKENIKTFKAQIQTLGLSFDWSREFSTTDPEYYKWTQWQFLQFFKHNMAYKDTIPVNWCPVCKSVLSNEDSAGGVCERCGNKVVQKEKSQWMLRMSDYAEDLLTGLEDTNFAERVKLGQINWIGKSTGAEVDFKVDGTDEAFTVFTTRCDTLHGATYCVLAPEHELVDKITTEDKKKEVEEYKKACSLKNDMERTELNHEKTGVFIGAYAINPVNGKRIPIYISDYVLASYGTGAIMAVPAHDSRDFEFAKKFNIPIIQVLAKSFVGEGSSKVRDDKPFTERNVVNVVLKHPTEDKYLCVHKKKFDWINFVMGGIEDGEDAIEAAKREVTEETGYNDFGPLEQLDFIYYDTFYAAHKDVNRHITSYTVVGKLNSLNKVEISKEESDIADSIWIDAKDVPKKLQTDAHRYDFERAINGPGAMIDDGVHINSPAKIKVTGIPHENEIKKKSIVALVYDEKNDKYLSINWHENGGRLFIGGTIKDGETPLECALREVEEETGYTNIELIRELPSVNHHYYAYNKDKYFDIICTNFLFKLISDSKKEQKLDSDEKFTVEWASKDVIEKEVQDELHRSVYEYATNKAITGPDLNNLNKEEAIQKTLDWLEEKNHGKRKVNYKMRDWVFSRQRFWGEPIPMVDCPKCGWVPLNEEDLPLLLPDVAEYEPTDNGESPLANITDWVNTICPKCGGPAKRETDTMPNWAGSSWYFLRYMDPHNTHEFASMDAMKYWQKVDWYNGGMEHTARHLLYARFWVQFLYNIGLVPNKEMIWTRVSHGMILAEDGEKMSKSKGNVVNPDEVVKEYGADALRCYELFIGDYEKDVSWSTQGLRGCKRFLDRIERLASKVTEGEEYSKTLENLIHKTIKKVTNDLGTMKYNTAVSSLMILTNAYEEKESITKKDYEILITLLNPIAPHITEELNENLGNNTPLYKMPWPTYDEAKCQDDMVEIGVQINGKLRGSVLTTASDSEDDILEKAKANENVQKYLEGMQIVKTIVIKGKIVNIVVKP